MTLLVKICGLSTPEALDVALEAGADMVGFVFFPPRPRNVSLETARALGEPRAGPGAQGRAHASMPTTRCSPSIVEALKPDMLQLHGHETPQRVAAVRESFGLPVMKALPIEAKSDLARDRIVHRASPTACCSTRGRRATRRGPAGSASRSTGTCSKISTYQFRSCFPAGSIRTMSRKRCASRARRGVDVSSGVESAPGVKDPEKIRAFIRARAVR